MGSALKLVMAIGSAFALSIAIALVIGYIVGSVIVPYIAGEPSYTRNPYVIITEPNIPVKSFTLNSTYGPLKIPVDGKVNVVTPQYVRCPDICHWETAILLGLFEYAYEENALDKIVFITIGVDPWNESLELARTYQNIKAGKWFEKGVYWIWVYDDPSIMGEVWKEYRIYVEKNWTNYLVTHWGGFLIVKDGVIRYVASPTLDGWASPAKTAEYIWVILREELKK